MQTITCMPLTDSYPRIKHCILPHMVIFYSGPPTPLFNLLASPEIDAVLISWSPSFSPFSVPVAYQVQVEEDHTGRLLLSMHTNSTTFLYTPPKDFCSVLQFKIYAFNRAGGTNDSVLTYYMFTSMLKSTM